MDIKVCAAFQNVHDEITDLNYILLQKYKKPLLIPATVKQVTRIHTWCIINKGFVNADNISVIHWASLPDKGYMQKKKNNLFLDDKWLSHDAILFFDSVDCKEPETYGILINHILTQYRKRK